MALIDLGQQLLKVISLLGVILPRALKQSDQRPAQEGK